MKVTLPDLTTIDCTVDEYEELIARGLVGKKLDELKVELEGQDGEKIVIPSPKKQPYHGWPEVVALYGCEIAQNPYNDIVKFDQNKYTPTDVVQKLNSVVINDTSNTDEE